MNAWIWLLIAIVSEVIATSSLKATEGFTRLGPSIVVMVGYVGSSGVSHRPWTPFRLVWLTRSGRAWALPLRW